jgi:alpha-glucosidase
MRSHVVHNSYAPSRKQVIDKVVFMGLHSRAPAKVYVNGAQLKAAATRYPRNGALIVGGLSLVMGEKFQIKVVM